MSPGILEERAPVPSAPFGVELTYYETSVRPSSFNYMLFDVHNSSCGGCVRLLFLPASISQTTRKYRLLYLGKHLRKAACTLCY